MWKLKGRLNMPRKEWLTTDDWYNMLNQVNYDDGLDDRFFRLVAAATCRLVWDKLDAAVRDCVRYSEYLADLSRQGGWLGGPASPPARGQERHAPERVRRRLFEQFPNITTDQWEIGQSLTSDRLQCDQCLSPGSVAVHAGWVTEKRLARLVRELLPDPVNGPPPIQPRWVSHECYDLAVALYLGGGADSLVVLGEYLKKGGCRSRAVLEHCAQEYFHPKGCWMLEGVLLGGAER